MHQESNHEALHLGGKHIVLSDKGLISPNTHVLKVSDSEFVQITEMTSLDRLYLSANTVHLTGTLSAGLLSISGNEVVFSGKVLYWTMYICAKTVIDLVECQIEVERINSAILSAPLIRLREDQLKHFVTVGTVEVTDHEGIPQYRLEPSRKFKSKYQMSKLFNVQKTIDQLLQEGLEFPKEESFEWYKSSDVVPLPRTTYSRIELEVRGVKEEEEASAHEDPKDPDCIPIVYLPEKSTEQSTEQSTEDSEKSPTVPEVPPVSEKRPNFIINDAIDCPEN
jgi:hypothetical protein